MQARTEAHLVGPPARGTKERFARRNFSALETKLHVSGDSISFTRWANAWASSGPSSPGFSVHLQWIARAVEVRLLWL
jgi:hypothetical protein